MKLGDNALNNDRLSLVKTKLPIKNSRIVALILLPYNISKTLRVKGFLKRRFISIISIFLKNVSSGLKIFRLFVQVDQNVDPLTASWEKKTIYPPSARNLQRRNQNVFFPKPWNMSLLRRENPFRSWNVLHKIRLDQTECFFPIPHEKKNQNTKGLLLVQKDKTLFTTRRF